MPPGENVRRSKTLRTANNLGLMAHSGPQSPKGEPPIDLDANRDLADQLLGQTLGPVTVIEARGSRGTSADGTDVYNLELELEVRHPFPVNLKRLKECQAWYQVHSGVKVSMRTHSRPVPS